jgi:hypothetical protein
VALNIAFGAGMKGFGGAKRFWPLGLGCKRFRGRFPCWWFHVGGYPDIGDVGGGSDIYCSFDSECVEKKHKEGCINYFNRSHTWKKSQQGNHVERLKSKI